MATDLLGPFDQPDQSAQDFSRPVAVFDPLKAPDYSKQGDPTDVSQDPVFDAFKSPPYEKQDFDPSSPVALDDRDQRPTRINREASGATGARSGSVSRERQQRPVESVDSIEAELHSNRRVTSMSPSRAMGARSASLGRRDADGSESTGPRGRSVGNGEPRSSSRGTSGATGFRSPSRG